jgi:5'-3' exonuclease
MNVVLIDGTYELFRHFYAPHSPIDPSPGDAAAVRGVLRLVARLLQNGATHIGVATDHVIESFRNDLWPGYKTGEGIDPRLYAQFVPLEQALQALGVTVWPMIEFEADDALASAAHRAATDPRVEQVFILTPDKDLAQSVVGDRVVQANSRTGAVRNEAGVVAKFGVPPSSIPDFLALVGDAADGYPGLPGWGRRSAAGVLSRFARIENIPDDVADWHADVRNGGRLAATLTEHRQLALLFRELATLRTNVPVFESVDDLRWQGPLPDRAASAAEAADVLKIAADYGLGVAVR